MKTQLLLTILCYIGLLTRTGVAAPNSAIDALAGSACPPTDFVQQATSKRGRVLSLANLCGHLVTLSYSVKNGRITMRSGSERRTVRRIGRRFDPHFVGADGLISFLPIGLQPYRERNIFLYTTAMRTSGGDGSVQCGSGVELFLGAVEIGSNKLKVLSDILIESCAESIYLTDDGGGRGKLPALSVADGRLGISFLGYGSHGELQATLSSDARRLELPAPANSEP